MLYKNKKEYEDRKAQQKGIYLSKVSSLIRGENFRKIILEAEKKFNAEYPPYKSE